MIGDPPLNPIRSVLSAALLWIDGRLRFPQDRVGDVSTTESGQSFIVYRETTVAPDDRGTSEESAVLAFRFHLRFMPSPVIPYAVRVFEPVSILTTPFFAGLPGFRTKLWLFDHDTGDYLGVYEWASASEARRYARALRALMELLSIPGSVSYEVYEATALEEYVAAHSPTDRDERASPRKSAVGWGAVAAALLAVLGVLYWSVVRPWYLRWGVTDEELARNKPGHDLAPEPAVHSTQAVTIDVPPEDVWPWLVQIGQGRAGFYSYDWLEQLVGADIHNIDRIIPEYQALAEGDEVRLAPKDYPLGSPDSWPVVADIEENRHIVLRPPTDPPSYVWTFLVEPTDENGTRLISRMRSPRESSTLDRLVDALTWDPAHFLMQRRMLLGIKERAERRAKP